MQPDRTDQLVASLDRRILIMDGAMGTMIQREKLSEADFRGERFRNHAKDLKGDNDLLVLGAYAGVSIVSPRQFLERLERSRVD